MTLAVTDTHALIWYATGRQRKLGRGARAVFERAERGEAVIYIPALVLVELAEAVRRGAIRADEGFSRWSERLLDGRRFIAAEDERRLRRSVARVIRR